MVSFQKHKCDFHDPRISSIWLSNQHKLNVAVSQKPDRGSPAHIYSQEWLQERDIYTLAFDDSVAFFFG